MNKTKSIVWLCVIVIVLALYAVVSFLPRFEISATDDFIPVVEQITLGTDLALSEYPNYRVAEGTVFNVNEYYTGIDGSYVDAEGNPVEDADKVKIPADELENFRAQIERRKELEHELKALKKQLPKAKSANLSAFITNVRAGEALLSFAASVRGYRRRSAGGHLSDPCHHIPRRL